MDKDVRDVALGLLDAINNTVNVEAENKKLKSQLQEIEKYCKPYSSFMWAAKIVGIIRECSFREVGSE